MDLSAIVPMDDTQMREWADHSAAVFAKERLEFRFESRELPCEDGEWLYLDPRKCTVAVPQYLEYLRGRGLLRYHATMPRWVQINEWECGGDQQPFSAELLAVQPAAEGGR